MKKIGLFVIIVLGIFLASCSQEQANNQPLVGNPAPQAMPVPEQQTPEQAVVVNEQANNQNQEADQENQKETRSQGSVKEFIMTAKQFEFVPGTIRVHKGDKVVLKVTALDVPHGFALPTFGINEQLPVHQEVKIEFVADQQGTFPFYCSVPCGSGHRSMKGELIVQ